MYKFKLFFFCILWGSMANAMGPSCACDFSLLAQKTLPAVVTLTTTQKLTKGEREQYGTGFFMDAAGHIATSAHNVKAGQPPRVTLNNGQQYPSTIVGVDVATDLAVLKVELPQEAPILGWASPEDIQIGKPLLAFGTPFGLQGTVTRGIVSAVSRDLSNSDLGINAEHQVAGYVQTDAALSVGNSGGPLVGVDGMVLGIVTVIVSPNGGSIGLGFAVPGPFARAILEQLKTKGKVERISLGIVMEADVESGHTGGEAHPKLRIKKVVKGSISQKAGLKAGDFLLKLQGVDVPHPRYIPAILAQIKDDEALTVKVERQGHLLDVILPRPNL